MEERERKEDKEDSSEDPSLSDSEILGESDLRGGECTKPGVGRRYRSYVQLEYIDLQVSWNLMGADCAARRDGDKLRLEGHKIIDQELLDNLKVTTSILITIKAINRGAWLS